MTKTYQSPLQLLNKRSATKQNGKPTCVAKIASHQTLNPQLQSPFFATLPAELRNLVFAYASSRDISETSELALNDVEDRPSSHDLSKIGTSHLRVCRRMYLECHELPLMLNWHHVYGGEVSHAPKSYRPYLFPKLGLKYEQANRIMKIHLHVQQFWLENWNDRPQQWHDFCRMWARHGLRGPEELMITLPDSGWWYHLLGERSPIALDPTRAGRVRDRVAVPTVTTSLDSLPDLRGDETSDDTTLSDSIDPTDPHGSTHDSSIFEQGSWGSYFKLLPVLNSLTLELETSESKSAQLDEVVSSAPSWHFELAGPKNILKLDETRTERRTWTSQFADQIKARIATDDDGANSVANSTFSDTRPSNWALRHLRKASSRRGHGSRLQSPHLQPGQFMSTEQQRRYYIVTLYWRSVEWSVEENVSRNCAETASAQSPTDIRLRNNDRHAYGRHTIPTYYGM